MSTDLKAFDFTSLFQKSLPFPTEDEVLPEGVSHGWYSAKMAEYCSTVVYKSEDGTSELTVTNLTRTAKHGLGYDDVVYVGRINTGVGGFVRTYKPLGTHFKIEKYGTPLREFTPFDKGDFAYGKFKGDFTLDLNIIPEPRQEGGNRRPPLPAKERSGLGSAALMPQPR